MAKKATLTGGIIGSGFAARIHYDGMQRVYAVNLDIAGVHSPTPENAKKFATEREIATFDTVDALIDACDVVHICAPPARHEELAIKTLEAGKHAVVEKPLTGYFGDGSPDFHIG
ncbi:MAG: Gfo/Idh/MocA family oxidoreductase, partial [Pseudomonadota bacterium]